MIRRAIVPLLLTMLGPAAPGTAQFYALETEHLRLVYYGQAHSHLVKQVARSYENALGFHRELYDWTPGEKTTVFIHDFGDYGNAGADVIPADRISLGIAPFHYVFETAPANERLNATMNHEVAHVVVAGKPSNRDLAFRRLFFGKVAVTPDDPVTMLYSYLTAPRRYAPRWYQEGIAVFLETWMAGGLGRSLGGYDEMVFRAMVRSSQPFYDFVGLESEGTAVDFQGGVNSYLYGTRFMGYLAHEYGPEQVIAWTSRTPGSQPYFAAEFGAVFGKPLPEAWSDWIAWERGFQRDNLARIRQHPVTVGRSLSRRALGSVSRAHYDPAKGTLYAAVNYPGHIAHIAALDMADGSAVRIADVKGPSLYSVSSVAYDAAAGRLFYTTDNNGWRDLRVLDPASGASELLLEDARVGDLAFNPADQSLWGVRHDNGYSTLVRIPPPYSQWNQVLTWPFGSDLYDVDVSPDGRSLTGALAQISGRQTLVRMDTDSLLAGHSTYEVLFDFGVSNPEGFAFSSDGRYLFGSSYYSGVSNIYRYDLDRRRMEPLTNAETGLFRPTPFSNDSLIAFEYSAEGFRPVMIANEPVRHVSAIRFLGQQIVEHHPVVTTWLAGSPGDIDIDARTVSAGRYHPVRHIGLVSAYPILQGYKNAAAVGLRMNFSDPIGLHDFSVSGSLTPGDAVPSGERWHAALAYRYREWDLEASYNGADFYDLFGPTKTSRKGYALRIGYDRFLLYDQPRTLKLGVRVGGYWDLERLPDFQNVAATTSQLYTSGATLAYANLRSSLGAVDYEKGLSWSLTGSSNLVNRRLYPRVHTSLHAGTPLPLPHSSLWLRSSAGYSSGDRDNPFANFYFGGFGNNWVDHQDVKRYHAYYGFPGADLNAIGGTNFGKAVVEWVLPPIRFRRAGAERLYMKWSRVSLFSSGLVTNIDGGVQRQIAANLGGQVDFRLTMLSYLPATLSCGYAHAIGDGGGHEFMVSLKIL